MKTEIKTALQQKEFAALKDKQRVVLRWATGVGKSKMVIDLVNHAIDPLVSGKFKHKVLFVVAERAHIMNWENEFDKWHLNRSNICTDVCCYASLKKYKDFHYDIVVLDEGHHVFTEKRMAALEELKNNMMPNAHVYLLSATLPYPKIDEIEDVFGKFTVSTISLKEAINTSVLPDPKVNIIKMRLDTINYDQEIVIGNSDNPPVVRWEDRKKYICRKRPCIIKCTQRQKYEYFTENMEYWKQRFERSHNPAFGNRWKNLGSQRKRYLGELKTEYVRQLIKSFSLRKRFICFCASVKQANDLNAQNTISSKRSTKLNQMIIDAFNAKKLHRLYAIGMANEGMNLTNIQAGIIIQLDGKERLFIQKVGRALRADSPVVYIFYYDNTQDENYLNVALENIEERFIKYTNINNLKTCSQ